MTDLTLLLKNGRRVSYSPPYSSFAELLYHHARDFGQKTALIGVDVDTGSRSELSYSDLKSLCIKVANYLTTLGIIRGDNIAILMKNTVEILLFEIAAAFLGAATVPLDQKRDTPERKIYKLKDTKAKVLFIKSALEPEEINSLSQHVKTVRFLSFDHFRELIDMQPQTPSFSPIADLESRYLILYTSGTTALPKGVPIRARALLANAEGIAAWQKLTPADRFSIILPLHHINSTTMSLATLLVGGTVVLNSRYSVSKFWPTVAQEKCTITSVVPTVIHDLLVRKDEFFRDRPDISQMKRILIGSAPVLPEETLRFYKTFKVRVVQGYGQTETALRVTGVPVDLSETEYIKAVKSNTIGLELANNNVTILKKDGAEAKEKEEGEICIRGPILADGYWNNPEETKKTFHKGWFHSGDLGYWEHGLTQTGSDLKHTQGLTLKHSVKFFYIIGRLKEIIIKGGVNLSPALIEDALLKAFSEIDEVSVVGYPDERMGEEVAAVIVSKKGSQKGSDLKGNKGLTLKIIEAGQAGSISRLSHYEAPKKVFIVNSLPKTSTGKIQRVEVKKMVFSKIGSDLTRPKGLTLIYNVRQIKPIEVGILKQALKINNARWQGLPSTMREFRTRAQNGLLFGVFDQKEGLIGTISCLRIPLEKVMKLKSWDEATAHGTLANHDPKGNTLLCVAISVRGSTASRHTVSGRMHPRITSDGGRLSLRSHDSSEVELNDIAHHKIEAYVNSNLDHVLEFHRKSKGGLPGAVVWKILPNGRPEDKDSMGYNILMKYPDLESDLKQGQGLTIQRTPDAPPSVALIEHVLFYAKEHSIQHVIAFSRPAGFRKSMIDELNEVIKKRTY